VGKMVLYVNRGLGVAHMRLRINCRPEITVITLQSAGNHDTTGKTVTE
jgi:predicted MPP superfamily phosphohydrolase